MCRQWDEALPGNFRVDLWGWKFNYKGFLDGKELPLFSFIPGWSYEQGHGSEVQPASHVSAMEREEDRVYT